MSTRSLRYNTMNRHLPKSRLASTDRDALAFLEAATIYNENHQRAIIELVRRLKSAGLWTKMKAIYPLIGGTASSHKWNLKDPRDSDAAFRLTFSGGWTHSSTGALPNGSTGYANTYIKPNGNLANDSAHYSIYLRTNNSRNATDIGVVGSTVTSELYQWILHARWSDGVLNSDCWNLLTNRISGTNSDSRGLITSTRTSTTSFKTFKNSLQFGSTNTNTANGFNSLTLDVYLAASNVLGSAVLSYSSRQQAFVSIGDGLTDTEATALYNIVDLYQKRLGRAV